MPEAFCPEHGPYDASLGACPYPHAGARPHDLECPTLWMMISLLILVGTLRQRCLQEGAE